MRSPFKRDNSDERKQVMIKKTEKKVTTKAKADYLKKQPL